MALKSQFITKKIKYGDGESFTHQNQIECILVPSEHIQRP